MCGIRLWNLLLQIKWKILKGAWASISHTMSILMTWHSLAPSLASNCSHFFNIPSISKVSLSLAGQVSCISCHLQNCLFETVECNSFSSLLPQTLTNLLTRRFGALCAIHTSPQEYDAKKTAKRWWGILPHLYPNVYTENALCFQTLLTYHTNTKRPTHRKRCMLRKGSMPARLRPRRPLDRWHRPQPMRGSSQHKRW